MVTQNYLLRRYVCGFFLLILLLAACSTSSPAPSSPAAQKSASTSSMTTGPTSPGLKHCQPASPLNENVAGGPEAEGTATNAELWGLIESTTGIPPKAQSVVKIVWKMTGKGDFHIVAFGPTGLRVPPSQGPAGDVWLEVVH